MGHSPITPAVNEPITLDQVKAQCRVTGDDENALLEGQISAARDAIQEYIEMQYLPATWELTLDQFDDPIELPRWPLQSIVSVKYIDGLGVLQTEPATTYEAVTNIYPGKVRLAYNKIWPSYRSQPDAIRIQYVAGYTSIAAIPARAKQAMLFLISHYYETREPILTGTISAEMPHSFKSLLWSLKQR